MTKTIDLISGYNRSKKPTMTTFRVVSLAEVKSWAISIPCTCHNGERVITVSDEAHSQRLAEMGHKACIDGSNLAPGTQFIIICQCAVYGHPGIQYRDITPSHVWFIAMDGRARQAKVNGKVKTWKRNSDRVELLLKYGMYECATFTTEDINNGRLLMPVEE